jgi:hypothetical protein
MVATITDSFNGLTDCLISVPPKLFRCSQVLACVSEAAHQSLRRLACAGPAKSDIWPVQDSAASGAPVLGRFGARAALVLAPLVLGPSGPRPLRSLVAPLLGRCGPQVLQSSTHAALALSGAKPLRRLVSAGPLNRFGAWCPRSSASAFGTRPLRSFPVPLLVSPSAFGTRPLLSLPVPLLVSVPHSTDSGQALGHFEIRYLTDLARASQPVRRTVILTLCHFGASALMRSAALPGRSLPLSLTHMLSCPIIQALSLGHDYFGA